MTWTSVRERAGQQYRSTLAELLNLLAWGQIKPIMAERFPLGEAARAHELLERGGHTGKVVLVPNGRGR